MQISASCRRMILRHAVLQMHSSPAPTPKHVFNPLLLSCSHLLTLGMAWQSPCLAESGCHRRRICQNALLGPSCKIQSSNQPPAVLSHMESCRAATAPDVALHGWQLHANNVRCDSQSLRLWPHPNLAFSTSDISRNFRVPFSSSSAISWSCFWHFSMLSRMAAFPVFSAFSEPVTCLYCASHMHMISDIHGSWWCHSW